MAKTYTAEQKAEIIKRADETSVLAASKEFGVSRAAITAWKKADDVKQTEKKVRGKAKKAVKTTARKVADKAAAETIEAKKTVRATGRKAKEAIEEAKTEAKKAATGRKAKKAELKEVAQDVALDAAIKVEDKALIEGIEAKKKVRATGRKAKDAAGDVKEKAKAATKSKPKAFKASYILQSAFGHELIVDEIQAKIPEDVEKVYIRIDQNKLHFIRKDGSTGSVDIW